MVVAIWLTIVIGVVPLAGWLLWCWNDIWYGLVTATLRSSNGGIMKLPPGHMGFPIIGELLTFLWYFKIIRRPDDFINSKRSKYGDGIGMYRTHMFGRPSVIVFLPTATKFVFGDHENFKLEWPNVELVGETSMFAIHGSKHKRLRDFLSKNLNQPDALRRVALAVQPRMISSLQSLAEGGEVSAYNEIKKVMFENVGMYFASIEPGTTLDRLGKYFAGVMEGYRAYRLNIPGSAFYHSIQCRKKAVAILKEKLETKKNDHRGSSRPRKDLMDDLMNLDDENGNRLSDVEVLDNMTSFLIGAHESTALVITWAIYFLAKCPNVLQKLRDENMSLRKSKGEQLVTSDDVLKLKYTTKVVDEALRIANVSAFLFRTAQKDVKYKGYIIPKGWNMILWIRYLHADAKNYDNPMSFNPDRWDASMAPGTYQPFGGGIRLCAGNMFARLQIFLYLHHLCTGYKWILINPDVEVKYLPHPLPVDQVKITIEKL